MKSTIIKKKTIVAFLVMLSFVITSGTFAYWTNNVEGTTEQAVGTLHIGSGNIVETKAKVTPGQHSALGELVPQGHLVNSEGFATEQIDFYYDLYWFEAQKVSQVSGVDIYGDVETMIDFEIYLNESNELLDRIEYRHIYELIHITEFDNNPTKLLLNSLLPEGYGFSVTMDEPANKTDYELISKSTIEFSYSFYINESTYDFNYNLVEMSYSDLLAANTISQNFDHWDTEEGLPLKDVTSWKERTIFFPVTEDEYTVTVIAQLENIDSVRNGYGVFFDSTFSDEDPSKDNGWIFQFDRGYAEGEMIVRERVYGSERNPSWRESSGDEDFFPNKYEDPEWWTDVHEIKIDVRNIDADTRVAVFYIDGVEIGSMTYQNNSNESQRYVGFRIWGGDHTNFYNILVE